MQFAKPGVAGAYFANGERKPWYKALDDPGFNQMKHLKRLMLSLPYFDRVPAQDLVENNGTRYERLAATRGNGYLLVYNHTGRDMRLRLGKISGKRKNLWWMDAATGKLTPLGCHDSKTLTLSPPKASGRDGVLIAIDSRLHYLDSLAPKAEERVVDRNE